jgi:hypothetical protein
MYRAAERWSEGVLAASYAGQTLGEDYIEITYEDLILDTAEVLRRVCNFLGTDFEPEMTTLTSPTENRGDTTGQVLVFSSNAGKYRSQLPKPVCKRIEELSFLGMARFNYAPTYALAGRPSGRFQRVMWHALDGLNLARSEVHKGGLIEGVLFHLRYFRQTRP